MNLSPEERRRIYEEEKARIEAESTSKNTGRQPSSETTTGLDTNIASMLCYVGGWVTGIIFLIIEQKSRLVRFHAAQSIVIFGLLTIIGTMLKIIPFVGDAFSAIVGIFGFILWIVLIVKTATGQPMNFGWISEVAEKLAGTGAFSRPVNQDGAASGAAARETVTEAAAIAEQPAARPSSANIEKVIVGKVEEYFNRGKTGRVASSAFSIAFSIAALVFFNYFNSYVAWYSSDRVAGSIIWMRTPFFTDDISLWLPVLTAAMVVAIVGHIIMIIYDRYIFRELMLIVIDCFSLASAIVLFTVFPFDFSVIPDTSVAGWVDVSVYITLLVVCIGIGIGILVKAIKLLVNVLQGKVDYRP